MPNLQERTGKTLICKRSGCGVAYYAAPSRVRRNEVSNGGYCSPDCAYMDRQGERLSCPVCGEQNVRRPNIYCCSEHYHEARKARLKQEKINDPIGDDSEA
jgi:hypothetical protein